MEHLFAQFIREKQFLDNVSPRTIRAFRDCFSAWKRTVGEELPTKENIKEFVCGTIIIYAHNSPRLGSCRVRRSLYSHLRRCTQPYLSPLCQLKHKQRDMPRLLQQ